MIGQPDDFRAAGLAAVLDRWDAVVAHWDLDEAERAHLLGGVEVDGVRFEVADASTYDHARGEERMRLLVEFALVLDRVHGHQRRSRFWLRVPNTRLGGASPIDVMGTSTAWIRWLIEHVGLTA